MPTKPDDNDEAPRTAFCPDDDGYGTPRVPLPSPVQKTVSDTHLKSPPHELCERQFELNSQIEELKHARMEAETSQDMLILCIEHAPLAIAMFDSEMRYIAASRRWMENYSLGNAYIVGKSHYEVFPEIPERWKQFHRRGLAGEVLHEDADPFVRQDGRVQWIRWDLRPWYLADGTIGGIMIFSEDVTVAKSVQEEKLAERDAYYRAAIESSANGFWTVDHDGRLIEVNAAYSRMSGYSREELLSMRISDIESIEQPEETAAHIRKVLQTGYDRFETVHRRKDGSTFPVEIVVNYRPETDLFFVFAEDITTRKQMENSIKESDQKFRILFESANDCLLLLSQNGCILDINPSGHERLGYSKEEMLGRRISEFDAPEFVDKVPHRIEQIKRYGQATFESMHRHKDGTCMPIEINCKFVEVGGEQVMFSVIRDIKERKRAEAELRIASVAFNSNEGMLITDARGVIQRVNRAFTQTMGYEEYEVIGKTPAVFKSGRHDHEFYRAMWDTLLKTGVWEGEVWDRKKSGEVFPKWLTITAVKDAEGKVTNYVGSHQDISSRKKAEEEIERLAFHDHLTDLPNRRLFMDRLEQAQYMSERTGKHAALVLIDLDNFKTLNDTLGHDKGDLLLQQVAKRLIYALREGDTVARLGGDEFVVLITALNQAPMKAAEEAEAIAQKIFLPLTRRYQLDAHRYEVTPSIGITLFQGSQSGTSEIIKQADIAMYEAKQTGRNRFHFFDKQMQDAINDRAALETDLRKTAREGGLALHYQAQVDASKTVIGAEALLRWKHPQRGFISPATFIPLAEGSDLILEIGGWVLDSACRQLKAWEQHGKTRNLVLSINVSARQFRQPNFVDQVREAVNRHAIDPSRLKLELTEGMLLENIEAMIVEMEKLRRIGTTLSLDDFGTGYSSLNYLRKLPLSQLKIDQSFVRDVADDPNGGAIVHTIIAMARTLKLDVVAEGVETHAQRQFLEDHGCTQFQGYLFGKPMPIDQFEALLVEK